MNIEGGAVSILFLLFGRPRLRGYYCLYEDYELRVFNTRLRLQVRYC